MAARSRSSRERVGSTFTVPLPCEGPAGADPSGTNKAPPELTPLGRSGGAARHMSFGQPARALWQAQTTSRALMSLLTPHAWDRGLPVALREGRRTWLAASLRAACGCQADHLARSETLTHARADGPCRGSRRPSTSDMSAGNQKSPPASCQKEPNGRLERSICWPCLFKRLRG